MTNPAPRPRKQPQGWLQMPIGLKRKSAWVRFAQRQGKTLAAIITEAVDKAAGFREDDSRT